MLCMNVKVLLLSWIIFRPSFVPDADVMIGAEMRRVRRANSSDICFPIVFTDWLIRIGRIIHKNLEIV